jgi:hypothetical protein
VIAGKLLGWHRIAALAPLLLLVVSLPTQVMLRCRSDGELRSSCCCPSAKEAKAPSSLPTLTGRHCCDREVVNRDRPAVGSIDNRHRDLGSVIELAGVVMPAIVESPEPRQVQPVWQRCGPSQAGPPLILVKQAFLI